MAVINIDDAYILDETGAQVDKTTGIPFKDEILTEAEAAQARANIRAGGTNPNLLDNPFFTVNQRGFTSGGATQTYVADRWFIHSNNGAGTITNTGKGLQCATTNTIIRSHQTQDYFLAELGKTFTFSVKFGGRVYPFTFTLPETAPSGSTVLVGTAIAGVLYAAITWQPQNNRVAYEVRVDSNGLFEAVKLELGSVSTLVNDAPPDYYDELDHCKWYFERIKALSGNYAPMGFGYAESATAATIFVPMHAKRGSGYTVSTSGSFRLVNGQTTYSVTAISKYSSVPNNWLILTVTSSGMTAGQPLGFGARGDSAAYIDVNDDL